MKSSQGYQSGKNSFTTIQEIIAATILFLVACGCSGTSFGQAEEKPRSADQKAESKPAVTPSGKTDLFEFKGGNLRNFIDAVNAHFGIDLWKQATIPGGIDHIAVPKMRIRATPKQLVNVLRLYNQLSAQGSQSPVQDAYELGSWVIIQDPGDGFLNALVFRPPKKDPSSDSALVKVFSLKGLNESEKTLLQQSIEQERERLGQLANSGWKQLSPEMLEGNLRYHQASGMLVATGGKVFVDLAAEWVRAFK